MRQPAGRVLQDHSAHSFSPIPYHTESVSHDTQPVPTYSAHPTAFTTMSPRANHRHDSNPLPTLFYVFTAPYARGALPSRKSADMATICPIMSEGSAPPSATLLAS